MPTPVVVDTRRSPHTPLRPVALDAVRLHDSLLGGKQQQVRRVILPHQWEQCEKTGRIDNFRRAAGQIQKDFQGLFFNDSDVYKWLEAAAWTLAFDPSPELSDQVDGLIDLIGAAQQPDGYLNTYFMFDKAAERWTNLYFYHEMYCGGHLLQAAVAHQRVTGSDRLMTIAQRWADMLCARFGPAEQGKIPGTDGHPEIEMALVELYRATGEARYLHQAIYFLEARGHGLLNHADYCQDEVPFRLRQKLAGHAVRALYLCCGAADIAAEIGDAQLIETLERLWTHMVAHQMYITGGVGARAEGEAIGADDELPNATAYCESCAAIASLMWSWRMLMLTGDSKYAHLMERALYNGILPGISLDGRGYFYVNPLANDGSHQRQPWFDCACCPPNLARLLATLPAYQYSVMDATIYTHLYAPGDAYVPLEDGRTIHLKQRTRYPWDGDITLETATAGRYTLALRIPDWAAQVEILLNDGPTLSASPGYHHVTRDWQPGDTVRFRLPLEPRWVAGSPAVSENSGQAALMRGPLVYCVEQADHPGTALDDLQADSMLQAQYQPALLGGVTTLRGTSLTAIPYYAWANREPGAMRVWLKAGVSS